MNPPHAFVTGAGSGIGAATARVLADQGYRITLVGRRDEALRATRTECPGGIVLTLDVTDQAAVESSLQEHISAHGAPRVVVHAAGATVVGAADVLTPAQWDQQMNVNLRSIFLLNRVLWPAMVGAGGGAIVMVASTASHAAFPQDAAYCASKGAVLGLMKAMALDGAPVGIRVNAVSPGYIDTPNLRGYFDAQQDPAAAERSAASASPMHRLGQAAEVAEVIAFLASPAASFVAGSTIFVDGGVLARVPTS